MPAPTAPDPHVIVVFGARGDLAKRKLLPGLYRLLAAGMLPERLRDHRLRAPRARLRRRLPRRRPRRAGRVRVEGVDDDTWSTLRERLRFVASSADDGGDLARAVRGGRARSSATTRAACSTSRSRRRAMGDMVGMLGDSGLAERARVVMEKPFGSDLASARELNAVAPRVARRGPACSASTTSWARRRRRTSWRFRFANGLFEPAGTATTSPTCRSTCRRTSASRAARRSTRRPARSATWSSPTSCSCSGFVAMEPPGAPRRAGRCATRRPRSSPRLQPFDPARRRLRAVRGLPRRGGRRRRLGRRDLRRRCASTSTTGAGRACRSCCAPARRWPRAAQTSRSASASRRCACSIRPATCVDHAQRGLPST